MKSRRQVGRVLVALLVVALGTVTLFAQDGETSGIPTTINSPNNQAGQPVPGNPSNDPPARVAR
ncbi:MAG TPA: hypothetical protein VF772_01360, partial [Terriglobales bacterium]